MSLNPASITKFRAMSYLDQWSADPATRSARYSAAIARLDDPTFDLLGATVAGVESISTGANPAPAPLDHLDDHWLSGQYFPNIASATIRDAIRTGFRAGIADAQTADLPLNIVWVCATDDSNDTTFRVDHVVGTGSVTIAVVTPKPAGF